MLVGYQLHTFNCKAAEVSRILVNCHLLGVFNQTLLQAKHIMAKMLVHLQDVARRSQ